MSVFVQDSMLPPYSGFRIMAHLSIDVQRKLVFLSLDVPLNSLSVYIHKEGVFRLSISGVPSMTHVFMDRLPDMIAVQGMTGRNLVP